MRVLSANLGARRPQKPLTLPSPRKCGERPRQAAKSAKWRSVLVLSVLAASLAGDALAAEPAPPSGQQAAYNQIVETRIQPQAEQLLLKLARDGRGLVLDGVPVFNGQDKFLPGKIALGLTDFLAALPPDDPRRPEYLKDFRQVAKLTVDDANDSWGIYYYLSALNTLRQAGVLKEAVDPLTLAKLRVRLDWRSFVDVDDFTLIDHPNNYYGVAFAIARLRTAMGWEDGSGSETLLARVLEHYRKYSGDYGFADETDGDGRFDRYSILLAAELSQRFIETGARPPPEILGYLRKSVDLMLPRLNTEGEGFEYGRSLGPYGETAIIEVMTAAAVLGVLSEREKDLAYAYATRAGRRYVEFWQSRTTGSVDLWDQGRRTDAYRGKFRILGENLSLAHQYVYTNAAWNRLGYRDKPPMADFAQALDGLPKRTVTWFARGTYDRLLLTLRDHGHVIGLPVVNGAASQHMHSPYFPIPYSPGMLSGVADGSTPQLIPQFTLADGSVLAPLAWFRDVKVTTRGDTTTLTWRQSELDRLGGDAPIPDDRLSVTTTYVLAPGRITRTDVYTPKGTVEIKGVAMEFASYSDAPAVKAGRVAFGHGAVRSFQATGFAACHADAVGGDAAYRTPTGPFASRVACASGPAALTRPLTLSWSLAYD